MTLIPFVFIFGLIPLLDALIGEDMHNPPAEVVAAMENRSVLPAARANRRGVSVAQLSSRFIAFVGTQDLPWWSYVVLLLGVGTIDGGALLIGHELGHKADRLNSTFGMLANNAVGYAHFRIEHNRGHHTWVVDAGRSGQRAVRGNRSMPSPRANCRRVQARLAQRGRAIDQARQRRRGRSRTRSCRASR